MLGASLVQWRSRQPWFILTRNASRSVKPGAFKTTKTAVDKDEADTTPRPRHPLTDRELPLPPILDPGMQAARNRHKQPKRTQPPHERTPLQDALALNPYAHILSTPIRSCSATEAVLPRALLQPFVTVFKQDEASNTLVPHLVPDNADKSLKRSYSRLSHRLLTDLHGARRTQSWQRLISGNMLEAYGRSDRRGWKYDPATPELILETLRAEVERPLRQLFKHKKPVLLGRAAGQLGDDISDDKAGIQPFDPEDVMCLLYFGRDVKNYYEAEVEKWTRAAGAGYVPCFDLPTLLGKGLASEMRQGSQIANAEFVAVKKHRLALDCATALVRLDEYLE